MSDNRVQDVKTKKKRKRKSRFSPGCVTFLVALGLLIYFSSQLYVTLRSSLVRTYILDIGEISNTIPKQMLILRKENVLRAPASGYISYHAEEGERLRKDGIVGKIQNEALKGDESIHLRIIDRRINELRGGVAVQNPEAEIGRIDLRIEFLFSEIQNRIREKDYAYIPSLKNELLSLVERKKLIQGASSLGDLSLEDLQAKKAEIENRVHSEKFFIRTPEAGILTFYHDGEDERFNLQRLAELSINEIEEFKDRNTISRREQVQEGEVVASVVDNHFWYFLTEVTKEDIQKIERGKSLRCLIDSETVYAVLRSFDKGKDGKFIGVFEAASENFDFTGPRRHEIHIEYRRVLGLKIKKRSVIERDGKRGIFVVSEVGTAQFKEIQETLGEDEDYIAVGYDPYGPKKDLVISLYDEVIEYPEEVDEGQRIR